MAVVLDNREAEASQVQEIFTSNGCIIRTRLGLHHGVLTECSREGLIILDVVGQQAQITELENQLNRLAGVKANSMEIGIPALA